jgi:hypothetical protein
MASAAYRDYRVRYEEVRIALEEALAAVDPVRSTAFSKSAVVLAAAALERYVNDVVFEAYKALRVATWEELTEGQQQYMATQFAGLLYRPARKIYKRNDATGRLRTRLRQVVTQCMGGFTAPDTWPHKGQYGVFLKGAAEPDRIDRTLRLCDGRGRSLFNFAEARGKDRRALATGLQGLIDARHNAAHALHGSAPSPTDVRSWIKMSLELVREIEVFLGFRRS